MIYGSDSVRAAALRTFSGGLMATSAGNLLPFNTAGLPNANDAHIFPDFAAVPRRRRARERKRRADRASNALRARAQSSGDSASRPPIPPGPTSNSFKAARAIVIARDSVDHLQRIPAGAVGQQRAHALPRLQRVGQPGITNEFSTAAYRFGHSAVGNDVEFLDNNGNDSVRRPLVRPGLLQSRRRRADRHRSDSEIPGQRQHARDRHQDRRSACVTSSSELPATAAWTWPR